jgi:hypothetical protein
VIGTPSRLRLIRKDSVVASRFPHFDFIFNRMKRGEGQREQKQCHTKTIRGKKTRYN